MTALIIPPKVIKHPIFGDFMQSQEILDFLDSYAKKPSGFLLLSGKNGTGKTYVAKAIYHRHTPFTLPAYDREKAYFVTQADLNEKWKRYTTQQDTYFDPIFAARKTKLLVIDDLGTRKPSEAFMDALYSIADDRFNDKLPTIITTNLNSAAMREQFGDAFVSRVASGKCFRFVGEDRRFNEF